MSAPLASSSLAACSVGANPIIWSNDDFPDLAGDVPLETILHDMRAAGYAGSELGHAYPASGVDLRTTLAAHELQLIGGWHSTFLATRDLATEEARFHQHLQRLQAAGAQVAIVAECSFCCHGDPDTALGSGDNPQPRLTPDQWSQLIAGLTRLVDIAAATPLRLAYHHHMGTVIQDEASLDRLMQAVPSLQLVLDPGHLAFAGLDPIAVARHYASRIAHVHLKSVRPAIVDRARTEAWSFHRAVKSGVFTIPGDPAGGISFPSLFNVLAAAGYRGWLVVEAEEDPVQVPALPKARAARDYVRQHTGA
ncbi:myo-inosose-2 dehydratase [Actomonas aquatica]|uniref:Myo-inosose-2 dehydratase n=1 Tax=Actomonas aquatica TaxID=2866162 RepID=A0ABZ1CC24_9BACT|nr:myo-inosose-2 dehydratase [Opitutus sp. WL0086]WRQ87840.1 myo-inosose-2 dehydratase [Opitutus sp. WL0086]